MRMKIHEAGRDPTRICVDHLQRFVTRNAFFGDLLNDTVFDRDVRFYGLVPRAVEDEPILNEEVEASASNRRVAHFLGVT